MGEVSYAPLIDDMVWSFSRIEAYESCPHRWYLRYIRKCKEKDKFYASYGSFMHKLIEKYYNGELTKAEMLVTYLRDFKKEVKGFRPKASTLEKFINGGVNYLKEFEPFPYKMLAVEKKVEFEVDGIKFIGFIDFLGLDESDGELVVIDNKSRDLRQRSTRAKPTVKDIRELAVKMKQEVAKYNPEFAAELVPHCQHLLWCPEKKASCHAYPTKDELKEKLKQLS